MKNKTEKIKFLKPLFIWAGGKTKLLAGYQEKVGFPKQESFTTYVEPFFGGGAMFGAVRTLYPDVPCGINDINAELVLVYQCLKDHQELFHTELKVHNDAYFKCYVPDNSNVSDVATPVEAGKKILDSPIKKARKAFYAVHRQKYWDMKPYEGENEEEAIAAKVKRAALLFFLMKTSFNGIWQSCKAANGKFGTPAGLVNQTGGLVYDAERLLDWEKNLSKTKISSLPYQDVTIPDGSWVYCDPPYRDSFTSYNVVFGDEEQERLIKWCRMLSQKKGCTVWLANKRAEDQFSKEHGCDFFTKHASDAKQYEFPVSHTAGRRKNTEGSFSAKKATEILLVWEPKK